MCADMLVFFYDLRFTFVYGIAHNMHYIYILSVRRRMSITMPGERTESRAVVAVHFIIDGISRRYRSSTTLLLFGGGAAGYNILK